MNRFHILAACAVLGAVVPLAAVAPTHAAATKTYTSTSCGYTVTYPAGWHLIKEKGDILFGQPSYNVRISCYKKVSAPVSAWLAQVKKNLSKSGFRIIGTQTAKNLDIVDVLAKNGEGDRFVGTKNGTTLYVFHYAATNKTVFNAHVAAFKALVDTFTFK